MLCPRNNVFCYDQATEVMASDFTKLAVESTNNKYGKSDPHRGRNAWYDIILSAVTALLLRRHIKI